MATLNMEGPYTFDQKTIDQKVTKKSAGNYALGRTGKDGSFYISYIGRSDTDLHNRLSSQLHEHPHREFKFSYANTALEAYEKECKNYHDFGECKKLENEIHPDKPYVLCNCPICKC